VIRSTLEKEYRQAVAADMLLSHHLARVAEAFDRSGVRHIVMKGEALARTHYLDPGTRARCDIDVFIHLRDIEAAREVLNDAGYEVVSCTYKSHQFTVRRGYGTGDIIQFDVHWRILNASRYARVLAFDEAYAEAIPDTGRPGLRLLSHEHSLLLACMHRDGSQRHDRDRLIWIYDIHLLFSTLSPDEQLHFASEAVARNIQACCLGGLERSTELFATVVPVTVLETLKIPEPPVGIRGRLARSNLGLLVDDWKHLAGWSERKKLAAELFAPSGDSLLRKYGKQGRKWIPWLYLRQVTSGLVQRLTLR
jgi:hypothetical protein